MADAPATDSRWTARRPLATLAVVVAADDRTGALETAGSAAAALGWSIPVVVGVGPFLDEFGRADTDVGDVSDSTAPARGAASVVVVDTGTRNGRPEGARHEASLLDGAAASHHLHKIDSTLRGNWHHELVVRTRGGRRPVLLVPALPELGRTCVGGVVLTDGRPVSEGAAGDDELAAPRSSEPAALLRTAGAELVTNLRPPDVPAWAEQPRGIAVCDASTTDDVATAVAAVARRPDLLVAGTSALAAPFVTALLAPAVDGVPVRPSGTLETALVVCGSRHPTARAQVEAAVRHGAVVDDGLSSPSRRGSPTILLPVPQPAGGRTEAEVAAAVASALAQRARSLMAVSDPDLLVLIGGDTAAAVLGADRVAVGGLAAPGTPWMITSAGRCVVTRAGGFGGSEALVELLWGTLAA